ncbi:MAG: type II toxin-antitoxin system RelE/ParE family toxin [Candidatus Latescibacteria bacterium]|nr:type II toxin-antitoxin system RelE/ParE family toxin [Candidatus Latescibacterota bacterium]
MEIVYTEVFENWLKRLGDRRARVSIVSRIERIEDGNFGDHKSVGVGKGYRAYYAIRRNTVVILLCGGDKSTQRQDIKRAQQMASEI